jgi:hypothetical protein
MDALGDKMTKRGERGSDTTACGVERVTVEYLIEPRAHCQRVCGDITERLHRSRFADASRFTRGVFDGLRFGADELAEELVEKASPICIRAHTRVGLQRVCRRSRELFGTLGNGTWRVRTASAAATGAVR